MCVNMQYVCAVFTVCMYIVQYVCLCSMYVQYVQYVCILYMYVCMYVYVCMYICMYVCMYKYAIQVPKHPSLKKCPCVVTVVEFVFFATVVLFFLCINKIGYICAQAH